MTFDKDLFISYAHIDNQPLSASEQGWVSRFHSSLEAMLSMRIGSKAQVWRDQKLSGNDVFADEIVQQFPKTAVLVSVLTPRYSQSDWCNREVREFCRIAEESGGVVFDNKARVIKIVKTPTENEEFLPAVMRQMLGYDFFTLVDDAPLELDPAYGPEMAQKYNLKMAKLAWDIAQLLKKLRASNGTVAATAAKAPAAISSKPSVYLAECSYDRREDREAIEGELKLHGYRTLPEKQLPAEEADYVAEVTRLLAECSLSIHLVGSSYGAVKDGLSGKSVVVLQNELAIQHSATGKLKRAIWLPEGTVSAHPEQRKFIEALQRDVRIQQGADLISGDFETFKSAVHTALRQSETPREQPAPAAGDKLVYLICNERDRGATVPLRKLLKARGLEVKIPLFEGDAASVRQANQELLAQCDGVLIFYGDGGEAWRRAVESDLKKAQAYRSPKPPPSTYTYLAGPGTPDKQDMIELEEPNVIDGLAGFAEDKLAPLLSALGSNKP